MCFKNEPNRINNWNSYDDDDDYYYYFYYLLITLLKLNQKEISL